jgi:3-dehydroquinate dehydratase-2
MKKILIINGPNLNMLGVREPEIYGSRTYNDLIEYIKDFCADKCLVDFYQSNHEGSIIDCIQGAYKKYDGIVINAGGYTHTSVAIPDAISTVQIPTAEVHISDITKRESFRHHSFLTDVCSVTIMGKGFEGYTLAIEYLLKGE